MTVPDGMLVLLREGPKHGYQLRTDFAERTNGTWNLNTGQVYTTLDRLERDGLVASAPDVDPGGDDRRQAYRLTDAGRERADAWLARVDAEGPDRDELVLRVLLVIGHDPQAGLAVVDGQRQGLLERLQAVRRSQRDAGDDLLPRLTADALAVRLEAELRWLDLCEDRLHAHARHRSNDNPSNRPSKGTPR